MRECLRFCTFQGRFAFMHATAQPVDIFHWDTIPHMRRKEIDKSDGICVRGRKNLNASSAGYSQSEMYEGYIPSALPSGGTINQIID
jgi:hypothetical protein